MSWWCDISFLLFAPRCVCSASFTHFFCLSFAPPPPLFASALWNMILHKIYIYIFSKLSLQRISFQSLLDIYAAKEEWWNFQGLSPPTPHLNLCVYGRRFIFTLSDAENCTGEFYSKQRSAHLHFISCKNFSLFSHFTHCYMETEYCMYVNRGVGNSFPQVVRVWIEKKCCFILCERFCCEE